MASVALLVGGALLNALAFSGSNSLFSKLGHSGGSSGTAEARPFWRQLWYSRSSAILAAALVQPKNGKDTTWPSSSFKLSRLPDLGGGLNGWTGSTKSSVANTTRPKPSPTPKKQCASIIASPEKPSTR